MNDSIPPGAKPATDVISHKIFINGTVLGNEISIAQITVNKSFNKIAYAKLTFLDGSASDRNFKLSNDEKFKPGNSIKVMLGYKGQVDTVFEGIIIRHGIKVRPHESSLLMIEAKDKAVKLSMKRRSTTFIGKKDSEILTQLADDMVGDIDSTKFSHKQMVQFEATDWDFMVTRAEANSMLVLTDDGKIFIKKPVTTGTPALVATYGKNIWEFEAEMDARRQIKEVTSYSWDFTKQTPENSDPGKSDFSDNGNLSSREMGTVLGASLKLSHIGHLTHDQLQDWSNAYAMRNQMSKIAGRVRIEGKADVKPGNLITLAGVGDRFNGNVFVTGVLHHFEGFWHTDIQFGWRDEWFYKKEDVTEKHASGLTPGINGLQIGIVLDVNDSDQGQYRVKVYIPAITTNNDGIWARVATLDAGNKRGVYFRPQKEDEVILGFLNDDPREAIILGYLHSKDKKTSPLPEKEKEEQYGFVTGKELKLIFDDTHKKMTLRVPAGNGEKTIILDGSGALELKDENQNSIKMGSDGITIQAAPGKNLNLNGTIVNINS
jgi:Rhs element Vgr protein